MRTLLDAQPTRAGLHATRHRDLPVALRTATRPAGAPAPTARPASLPLDGLLARAVVQRGGAGGKAVLARKILDAPDPAAAWARLTPARSNTPRGGEHPEILHVDELLGALSRSGAGSKAQTRRLDILLRLKRVLTDWRVRGLLDRSLGSTQRKALDRLLAEVNRDIAADDSEDWIDELFLADRSVALQAHDPRRPAAAEYVEKGGMPRRLKRTYLDDYKRIRALLSDKAAVRKHLQIIEADLAGDAHLGLLDALRHYEGLVGFSDKDVIPLGILSVDEFFGLLREGLPFKDVGAGMKHGEITHRLQWFVIAAEITAGFSSLPKTGEYAHTPIELYTYLGSPDMRIHHDDGGYKASLFGYLFDQGGSASDLYNQPDRIHMELLGLDSWNRLEERMTRNPSLDWTSMAQHFEAQPALPHLAAKLRARAFKRAQEDAAIRTIIAGSPPSDSDLDPYWNPAIQQAMQIPGFDVAGFKARNRDRFARQYHEARLADAYKQRKVAAGSNAYTARGPLLERD